MELKTISEISALSITDAAAYISEVSRQDDLAYDRTIISSIINHLRLPLPEVLDTFVVNYMLAYIIEYYDMVAWTLQTGEYYHIFSDPDKWVFGWSVNGGLTHYVVLTVEQYNYVSNILVTVESGVMPENITDLSMAILEADAASMATYGTLLHQLTLYTQTTEIIPELSETLELDESTTRFSSAIWFEEIQKKIIVLAGLGGIGSYVAFLLARMHPKSIFLYDDDKVELVNMAGQLYSLQDVDRFKVDAIASMMQQYSTYNSTCAIRQKFTEDTEPADIMICGFDNMAARYTFFQKWLQHVESKPDDYKAHCLFLDGRLAAEELQVLCIRGDDTYNKTRYQTEFLFTDAAADETLCSYKQTTYMANMIGSIMVNLFTNFVANELVEGLRDLPFFTSYSADSMMFKTEQ